MCVLLMAFGLGRHISWTLAVEYANVDPLSLFLCSLETIRKTFLTWLCHLKARRKREYCKRGRNMSGFMKLGVVTNCRRHESFECWMETNSWVGRFRFWFVNPNCSLRVCCNYMRQCVVVDTRLKTQQIDFSCVQQEWKFAHNFRVHKPMK